MPAVTVVTFVDADGDEFPIAIPGYGIAANETLEAAARDIIHEEEKTRPKLPLMLKKIERPEV